MVGKTTDFIATNVLVLPLQYVIMIYFSSGVAYVNGMQVAWYYDNDRYKTRKRKVATDPNVDTCTSLPFIKKKSCSENQDKNLDEDLKMYDQDLNKKSEDSRGLCQEDQEDQKENDDSVNIVVKEDMSVEDEKLPRRYYMCKCIRFTILVVMGMISVVFGVGLIWNTGSWFGLCGPVTIITVLGVSHVYYTTKTSVKDIQSLWMTMSH